MTSSIQPSNINQNLTDIPATKPNSIDSIGTQSLKELQDSLQNWSKAEKKAWARSKNAQGLTPLGIAIESHTPSSSKLDIIRFLVDECEADPKGDENHWTPLYRSTTGSKTDVLKFLLERGADPNTANSDQSIPLHRAVDRGAEEDVRILLEKSNVNAINCFGTPLAYAAKNGNLGIAGLLLANGANPNLVGEPLADTPLELAVINNKEEMKQLLLSVNGQMTIPLDSEVHTFLSRLVATGDNKAILDSFSAGKHDEYGRSAAHYCAYFGRLDLLEKMMDLGNIHEQDKKGRSPLFYAIKKGHANITNYVMNIEVNTPIDIKDLQGYSPLMTACQYHQVDIAKNLLKIAEKRGILNSILDSKDNFGWMAIHKAAQVDNEELLKLFVEIYHVDHQQKTSNGRTPLELAETTKAQKAIDYLKNLKTPFISPSNYV